MQDPAYLRHTAPRLDDPDRRAATQEGRTDETPLFSAYRLVSAVRIPLETVERARDKVRSATTLSSVKTDAGIDPVILTAVTAIK